MKAFVIAIIANISVSTYKVEGANQCTTTYPICGIDSKLCPHNQCTKPNGGKCNRDGDGCLDIRWNRDGCLAPENTCGSSYCGKFSSFISACTFTVYETSLHLQGTPPDFTDCSCDEGVCIVIGPQNTFAPTSSLPIKSPSSSPTNSPVASPTSSPSQSIVTNKPSSSPSQSDSKSPTNAPSVATNKPTVTSDMDSLPTTAPAPSASFLPLISSGPTSSLKPSELPSVSLASSISAQPTSSVQPTGTPLPSTSLSPTSGGRALLDIYLTGILLLIGWLLILI